ncbi:MAG: hypothetical protein M3209_09385 [Acidobacteriota bacterium]|nr:hypothetical protein [Acidobacteriota bacterium]
MQIKTYKMHSQQFDQIIEALQSAVYTIGQNRPLDWEDRLYAETRIFDAICELQEIRRKSETINFAGTTAKPKRKICI